MDIYVRPYVHSKDSAYAGVATFKFFKMTDGHKFELIPEFAGFVYLDRGIAEERGKALEAEMDMQRLDAQLGIDEDGLDESGAQLWDDLQTPEAIEELSEDEHIECSAQRWQESQTDQGYWQQHQAPWQDHSPICNCPSCCGDEPEGYDPRREEF